VQSQNTNQNTMKTLKDHMVLFDAECPMCSVYTKAFVKTRMLDNDGRSAYQHVAENTCPVYDRQRAVNEIALVNLKSGEVTYGIKSLFKIIGNAFPLFTPLFAFKPFIWLMSKAYAFISYNRRVIIPPTKGEANFAYQPTFKRHYRIAYLLFTWFFAGFILTAYAHLLTGLVPLGNTYREYMICGGQIIFQGAVMSFWERRQTWTYLGNMMTISFAGSLLLLIPLAISHWFKLGSEVYALCFMGVAGLMFLEHIRRTQLLNLGWVPTITWVAYRIILLALILNLN
jgi:predicted DCC family thiol-disulfide oxidoreductase YuxK